MVLDEDPATDGGGDAGGRSPTVDPQRGEQDGGTDAKGDEEDQTRMEVDGQDQQIGPQVEASAQAQPHGLPSLQSRRPMDFVETMAQISLLRPRAMGGVTVQRGSPQAGRAQTTNGSQGGSEFIIVPTAQEQGAGLTQSGEIPTEGISRE